MELALSLGDKPKGFTFLQHKDEKKMGKKGLGFCMAEGDQSRKDDKEIITNIIGRNEDEKRGRSYNPPVRELDLLPTSPVLRDQTSSQLRFRLLSNQKAAEPGSTNARVELNRRPSRVDQEAADDSGAAPSSPTSAAHSSFQIDYFSKFKRKSSKRDFEATILRESDHHHREEDEEEEEINNSNNNGGARKKLRLSKDQSAFLEESFKQHITLNPKQKHALAKQLNLRPRQVEVWFQNRRARTKLKQTEIDCEYLKRCCEALTEENRRLQKELHELRALKTSQPFYMQLPATTLTVCSSCDRIVSHTTSAASRTTTAATHRHRNA